MRSFVDSAIGTLAPHRCVSCFREGAVLCDSCVISAGGSMPSRCAGCQKLTKSYRTCSSCRSWLVVTSIYVAVPYESIYKHLLKAYKFDVQRQAAKPMARIMSESFYDLPTVDVICPVPTVAAHVRMRGFDHAKRLALAFHDLAKNDSDQQFIELLGRRGNVRQVGSSRTKRITQIQDTFFVTQPEAIRGKTILLIDDVITTGATLSAAAQVLRKAGAKYVYAAVFAQKV